MSKLIARGIAPKSILRKPKDILRDTVLRNLTKAGLRRIRTNRSRRKKYIRRIVYGIINVQTTFNNTIVTVTDGQGQVAWWASGGASGSKGPKRGTPFAAQNATKDAIYPVIGHQGMRRAEVRIRGSGPGRDAALRVIKNSRIRLRSVYDITPVPHNGCRPPKKRQV